MKYTTIGSVRGCCDHKHRSLLTAMKCIGRDHDGCAKQGGYSDRYIVHLDGTSLTGDELEHLAMLETNETS